MDTLLIIRDSVATCVGSTAETCQPCGGTNDCWWFCIGAIILICVSVIIIFVYGIDSYYKYKENERLAQIKNKLDEKESESEKNDKQNKSSDEKALENEIKRQTRVADLMKEICELTREPGVSKDIKGNYNNDEAKKLWDLYKDIDSYNKAK